MKFLYTARNKEGQVKQGVVVASSQDKAEALLMENGFTIVAIKEQAENIWLKMVPFGKRVSYKEVVLFSRQLSTLIGARVPILQSLRILEGQISSKPLVAVVRDMITSVENGESFSLALSKHPKIFGNVYISLVIENDGTTRIDLVNDNDDPESYVLSYPSCSNNVCMLIFANIDPAKNMDRKYAY